MLKVLHFIELSMMTGFDHARQQIEVADDLVGTQILFRLGGHKHLVFSTYIHKIILWFT